MLSASQLCKSDGKSAVGVSTLTTGICPFVRLVTDAVFST